MNKTIKNLSILICLSGLAGCQRQCNRMDKKYQSTNRTYIIDMYSGGRSVFHDSVRTIINDNEQSDGCYYYKDDTLIEVSGDYVYKSVK